MGKVWCALFSVLAIGCIGDMVEIPEYRWHADETFTPEERTAIVEGFDYLAEHAGGRAYPIDFDLPHPADGERVGFRQIARRPGGTGGTAVGCAINIGAEMPPAQIGAIAAHELGHCIGFEHHDEPGLMFPVVWGLMWTDADERVCREAGWCFTSGE